MFKKPFQKVIVTENHFLLGSVFCNNMLDILILLGGLPVDYPQSSLHWIWVRWRTRCRPLWCSTSRVSPAISGFHPIVWLTLAYIEYQNLEEKCKENVPRFPHYADFASFLHLQGDGEKNLSQEREQAHPNHHQSEEDKKMRILTILTSANLSSPQAGIQLSPRANMKTALSSIPTRPNTERVTEKWIPLSILSMMYTLDWKSTEPKKTMVPAI